jgi:hypothetical protein
VAYQRGKFILHYSGKGYRDYMYNKIHIAYIYNHISHQENGITFVEGKNGWEEISDHKQ